MALLSIHRGVHLAHEHTAQERHKAIVTGLNIEFVAYSLQPVMNIYQPLCTMEKQHTHIRATHTTVRRTNTKDKHVQLAIL